MRQSRGVAAAFALLLGCGGVAVASAPATHVVQPGDTLYSLAKRYGTSVAALVATNGLDSSSYLIRVGQRLQVTGAEPAALVASSYPKSSSPGETAGKGAVVRSPEAGSGMFTGGVDRGAVIGRPPEVVAPVPPAPAASPVPAAQALPLTPTPAVVAAPNSISADSTAGSAAASTRVIQVTEEERLLLARLVLAEAGNEPAAGQLGVAAVVVNRVRHPAFPKSVAGVVGEPGQFKAVELGRLEKLVPGQEVLNVVDRALAGEDPTNGALFFYNPVKSVALDFWKTRPVTAVIGGHNFAR